jgi:hypothetical protein
MALRRSWVRIPLGPQNGAGKDLPLHIQREAGVVGHSPESEEKWCKPCIAQRSARAELAGGILGYRLHGFSVLMTALCE